MKGSCLFILALIITSGGCSAPSTQPSSPALLRSARHLGARARIAHIIIIVQENRSFENFFAGYPGANAPTSGCGIETTDARPVRESARSAISCPAGDKLIALHQITFENGPNLSHEFESAMVDWHGGKMDGFTHWGLYGPHEHTAAYAYVERAQVAPYWEMAKQYVLADNMFPTEFGPSWTAHLTLVAGNDNLNDTLALADFADGKSNCKAAAGTKTTTVDANRIVRHATGPFPCLNQFNSVAEALDTGAISWRYYVAKNLRSFIWSPFAAIKYVFDGPDWGNDIVAPETRVLQDLAKGRLAAVTWVTPNHADSDHPGAHSDTGPSWVSAVVNAVGESEYWDSSAIVVLWDDWGGFYDNAAPPQLDFRGLGFRVPCLIISPYAKRGVVVHTQYEFGSILKFIRETFGLPPLGPASAGYTDTRAHSISDSFDFNQSPRAFTPISSKYPMQHFLHEPPSNEPVDEY